jgi:hypothetical protein
MDVPAIFIIHMLKKTKNERWNGGPMNVTEALAPTLIGSLVVILNS